MAEADPSLETSRHPLEAAPFAIEAQGHALRFFPGGADRLDALVALIDGARRTLKVCFYIYAPDACGERVRDALAAAARRVGTPAGREPTISRFASSS